MLRPSWYSLRSCSKIRPAPLQGCCSTRKSITSLVGSRPSATCLTGWRARDAIPRRSSHDIHRDHTTTENVDARVLPLTCPGCGAPSQTIDRSAAGFYNLSSNRAQAYFGLKSKQDIRKEAKRREDEIYQSVLQSGRHLNHAAPVEKHNAETDDLQSTSPTPICDRCHALKHQSMGESIIHPSMESIQAMIEESPHKNNHIYHVLDAADFPMSLIPNLTHTLDLPRLRTRNRRSKNVHYTQGRTAEVSFIITRSDLLAPKKEQVDSLMPYLQMVLREALGRGERQIRLGNVRCVSAKRGWWTKTVKEEIWNRGGAGWMVGKVNVGKSALYEAVFPKGRNQSRHLVDADGSGGSSLLHRADVAATLQSTTSTASLQDELDEGDDSNSLLDETTLLPPPRLETAYPDMPIVSSLPGTTASPIRIPFGNGKGELVDLPGIHRSQLEEFVQPEHRSALIMKHRIVPASQTLKPGQSLLLGGLIRITPQLRDNEDLIFMAYPFVPDTFHPHVTGTHKAIAIQTGVHDSTSKDREGELYTGSVTSIATDSARAKIASAGVFPLEWDVTKRRSGPLTDRAAGKLKTDQLPFIVYSTDILIEGVGWIELTCQVRRRANQPSSVDTAHSSPDSWAQEDQGLTTPSDVPAVEVFSPSGAFIGSRRPMNAWELGGPKKIGARDRRKRPRQSIGMKKRQESSQVSKKQHV